MIPTSFQVGHGVKNVSDKLFSSRSGEYGQHLDMMIEGWLRQVECGRAPPTPGQQLPGGCGGPVYGDLSYLSELPSENTLRSVSGRTELSLLSVVKRILEEISRIGWRFISPRNAVNLGGNLTIIVSFGRRSPATRDEGFGTINQGFLEMSNVKVVEEMVNLIMAQRAYEINSKAIQAADEMLQTANNLRR